MKKIRAIETVYKNYRFRSRLEARWAIYFDSMSINWEYEVEGYDLGKDGYYLPDFYLPEFGVFIEVKPTKRGKNKCGAFRDCVAPIILCYGPPGDNNQVLYCSESNESNGGEVEHEGMFTRFSSYEDVVNYEDMRLFSTPPRFVTFETVSRHQYYSIGMPDEFNTDRIIRIYDMFTYRDIGGSEKTRLSETIRLFKNNIGERNAVKSAKQARFEHGEQPIIY